MMKYTLLINQNSFVVNAEPHMPLLWVLRDILHLTGTKYGCGKGLCGACTVHIDGNATRSCLTKVSDVGQKRITTIEGLSLQAKNGLHRVQQAWIDADVPQCGFCQGGQIMQASSFLQKNPIPTDEQIDQAMSGNLCRCGTYTSIKSAINLLVKENKKS